VTPAGDQEADRSPVDWRRLLGWLSPYKARMAVVLAALALSSASGLVFPLLVVRLLGTVLRQPDLRKLDALTLALVGLFLFQSAVSFVQSYGLTYVGERIVLDIRTALFRHLQALSLDFYADRRVGEIVSRLSSDVTQVRSVLTSDITLLLGQGVSLLGSVVIVAVLNPRLTAFILLLVPPIVGAAVFIGRRFEKLSTEVQDGLAEATVTAEESLSGVRVVKSFARESFEAGRYDAAMRRTFALALRLAVTGSLFSSGVGFLGFSAIAAVLWFGGREVIAGRLSLPLLSGFLIYGITIAANVGSLAGLYGRFRGASGAARRVFEILDTAPTIFDAPDALPLPAVQGRITLDCVAFHYDAGTEVLADITLDIAPGEIVALVGPSGAGKSTLFNLIPRFYDPTGGVITVDGHDLRGVTLDSLRGQVGLVPQETLLFGGTVRENIAYGPLGASDEEIEAAARAANAHGFISEMSEGYGAVVGERGVKLSGGQRQRIAIARAVLKDPRILLLDEATSALDAESEALVQDALGRLMVGRTVVIIAHRLSTVRAAHRIAVLERGRLIEVGTHADLLAGGGLYARLYAMQFRETD